MSDKLDMTLMFAMHNALRRELEFIAKTAARTDDDPRRILATAVGWEMFKKALHIHHTAEDEAIWPVMREVLTGRPDDLALLDAMESEHAAIDPLLDAIDAALADRESGPEHVAALTEALADGLRGHLKHEEDEGLPLIDATMTLEQWMHYGQVHSTRTGPDTPRLVPWLLDGADEEVVALMLTVLPDPVRAAYQNEWQPAYSALDRWNARA
ncbi:hemerythrin domain-containing protein [Actinomadura barringtoniae]|uniref:Hemerythrin domain-containing protein n=1 Tax=Actinomadura barringtoniae TaxID=1427535 RepID=A0A939PDI5_9ACTN|nr:hemerythrin domain-containing protein [Actinomadura barringtoniae]MBO2450620.1 hemerythrin domain-containing protein [Actinomadura barringtoniae]